jgi:hypothetical protein
MFEDDAQAIDGRGEEVAVELALESPPVVGYAPVLDQSRQVCLWYPPTPLFVVTGVVHGCRRVPTPIIAQPAVQIREVLVGHGNIELPNRRRRGRRRRVRPRDNCSRRPIRHWEGYVGERVHRSNNQRTQPHIRAPKKNCRESNRHRKASHCHDCNLQVKCAQLK